MLPFAIWIIYLTHFSFCSEISRYLRVSSAKNKLLVLCSFTEMTNSASTILIQQERKLIYKIAHMAFPVRQFGDDNHRFLSLQVSTM